MKTFSDYLASFTIPCDLSVLDFGFMNNEYGLFEGTQPLLTPGGHPLSHPSEALIRTIMTDLQLESTSFSAKLSAPFLFCYMKDLLEVGTDPIEESWSLLLEKDPFVAIKTTGNSSVQPYTPVDPLFSFSYITLSALIGSVNQFAAGVLSENNVEENEAALFPEIVRLFYRQLSLDKKVAVNAMIGQHGSGIVLPLLLVSGEITSVEYVKGLISLRMMPQVKYQETLSEVTIVENFVGLLSGGTRQEQSAESLIKGGEGDACEFKSTLRWDIRAGKTNHAIERACLKTIAAFLNSSGGHLLIGVRDDGSIEGIETDRFSNEDKFLLHLWMLIRSSLGRDFTPYIRTRLEKKDDKTFCIVSCLPANRPVFLRQPGFPEELFIRVGPSSNAMNISEALVYIANHFEGNQPSD